MTEFVLHDFYTKLPIPDRLSDDIFDEEGEQLHEISNLSKVNLFVGANNSGKSLLLREILKCEHIESVPSKGIKSEIISNVKLILNELKDIMTKASLSGLSSSSYNTLSLKELEIEINTLNFSSNTIAEFMSSDLAKTRSFAGINTSFVFRRNSRTETSNNVKEKLDIVSRKLNNFLREVPKRYSFLEKKGEPLNKIYIPTIRSLRKYEDVQLLATKTKEEYKFKEDISIQNGQGMYEAILSMITDSYEVEIRKTQFEDFLSKEFFSNKPVKIKPLKKINELVIKIGNEKERPIYDLGEGLQMMLILTFPLFFNESGIITIEEPEIFLHPGFQHKLINTFINHPKSKNFIFLISTHSNHILDSSNYYNNISICSMVKKLPEGIEEEKDADFVLRQLTDSGNGALELLGVRNTSVYLANSTIWVEGVTDMLYLRKYIDAYLEDEKEGDKYFDCKSFQEGIHYAFILSGGANIIHYDFSDKPLIESLKEKVVTKNICGKAFVIVDDDNKKNSTTKAAFFKELKGRFKVLPVIEIENLLHNDVIKKTIQDFPSHKKTIIDDKNLKEEKQYAKIRLGSYIDDHILKGVKGKKFKENKSSKDSTINCKMEFCKKALPHITKATMTKNSITLVKEILDFIISKIDIKYSTY